MSITKEYAKQIIATGADLRVPKTWFIHDDIMELTKAAKDAGVRITFNNAEKMTNEQKVEVLSNGGSISFHHKHYPREKILEFASIAHKGGGLFIIDGPSKLNLEMIDAISAKGKDAVVFDYVYTGSMHGPD